MGISCLIFYDTVRLGPPATLTALTVAQINQWMKNAVTLDWDSVNANRPAWNARWNKTIER